MKNNLTVLMKGLVAAAFVFALGSCARETLTDDPRPQPGPDSETVLLSIEIPGAVDGSKTRSLADDDAESSIASIDVIQVKEGKYILRAVGYDITGSGTTRTFKANLERGVSDLVIVANARTEVNDAVNGTNGAAQWVAQSTTAQAAVDELNLSIDETVKLTSGGVLAALPMFGYVKGVDIQKGTALTSSDGTDVKMIRSVAKIEVVLSSLAASGTEGGTGNDNFKLLDARLYNQALQGWVVPALSTWPANNIATAAYYGGSAEPSKAAYPAHDPLEYAGTADNVTDDNILRAIYTFEAPAGSDTDKDNNTCLVVGGYYNGSSQPSYYRVDIRRLNEDSSIDYLPLLRNHRYTVNVMSVTGPGYPDPDQAFYGETSLMEVNVLPWNDGEMSQVIFDGQHYLGINKGVFDLFRNRQLTALEDRSNILVISTNVPAGWKITAIDYEDESLGAGWLSVDQMQGTTGKTDVLLQMEQENISGSPRRAFVTVKAGRLEYVVTVIQSNEAAFFIQLVDENGDEVKELFFTSGRSATHPIVPQEVFLQYSPWESPLDVGFTDIGTGVDLSAGQIPVSIPGGSGSGSEQYIFQPKPFTDQEVADDPFLAKTTRIIFQVEHPTTKLLRSVPLYIYQQVSNLTVAQNTINAVFTGSTYNVQFSTNADWEVEFGGASPGIATAESATSGGAGTSQNFRFSVPLDLNAAATSFTIIFKSPTGEFADQVVTVNVQKPTLSISPTSKTIDCATYGIAAATTTFTITTNIPLDLLSITRTGVVTNATLNSSTKVVTVSVGAATASTQTGTVVVKAGSLSATFNVTREAPTLTISPASASFTYAAHGGAARNTTFTVTTNCPLTLLGLSRSGSAISANPTRSGNTITVPVAAAASSDLTGTVTVSIGSLKTATFSVTRGKNPGTPIGGIYMDATTRSATWTVANTDCTAKGGRLPTVAEWHAVAPTASALAALHGSSITSNAGVWINVTQTCLVSNQINSYVNGVTTSPQAGIQRNYRCVYP